MIDYYLKFASEVEADKVLANVEGSIDVIGKIYEPTGKMIKSADGDYTQMVEISGWHVNVRLVSEEGSEALKKFAITPTTPIRVWG